MGSNEPENKKLPIFEDDTMKRTLIIVVFTMLIASLVCGSVVAGPQENAAPNSGDGVPDGAGWDEDHWPADGKGPAPNSGDGIPDGPGW
jgi:hypothetical protein